MGLGKTVQVIFALRLLFAEAAIRSALVVCPKGLIEVWERECRRWAPELGVAILGPGHRVRESAWSAVVGHRHVLVTNYEQLRTVPAALTSRPPDVIVADEAHRLRKWENLATAALARIPRRHFWALTGTPLERDLEDFATLLTLVAPERFAPDDARLHPASLRSMGRPWVLRRMKEEVLGELPAVTDSTERVRLAPEQAAAYNRAVAEYRRQPEPGAELALLTRLQGICNLHEPTRSGAKLERILERLTCVLASREKAVVFCQRVAPLHELARRAKKMWGPDAVRLLLGEMSVDQRTRSVCEFRARDDVFLLAASSRVGGEGLTLVEANHVFFVDQWWNPSANDQARDRVVRIGQKRPVRVYRYCCVGTIEERLEEILAAKKELFRQAVDRLGPRGALATVVDELLVEALVE